MQHAFNIPIVIDKNEYEKVELTPEHVKYINEWIKSKVDLIYNSWKSNTNITLNSINDLENISKSITQILGHKQFNFQSKNKIANALLSAENKILTQINKVEPINFFLLYNGGYRSSPFDQNDLITFEPNHTEILLIYQISLLHNKIKSIYSKGIEFTILINNGVAKWVNDISIQNTESYANKLKDLINYFGANKSIKVLTQTQLLNFNPNYNFDIPENHYELKDEDYLMVKRYLGRDCSVNEAGYRANLYKIAEAKWTKDLLPIAQNKNAIILRQVAYPDMLSFRPFPGGATRIQNGCFGFYFQNNKLHPKLITSVTLLDKELKFITCNLQS
jgi:hypothetical protein